MNPLLRPAFALLLALPVRAFAAGASGLPNFKLSPAEVAETYVDAEKSSREDAARIAAIPKEARTFDNTVKAFERLFISIYDKTGPADFLFDVSPDAKVREAASKLKQDTEKLRIELASREDLYRAVKEYAAKGEYLAGESAKLLKETLRDFRRNGLELSSAKREELKKLQKRLNELSVKFEENINNNKDGLALPEARLKEVGLSEDYIQSLAPAKDGGKFVSLRYPDYIQFMEHCRDRELRKTLYLKFLSQTGGENTKILEEMLVHRARLASLLGYKTYADYAVETRMVKTPEKVWEMLRRLSGQLKEPARKEMAEILEVKRKEEPGAEALDPWDVDIGIWLHSYYISKLRKQRYSFDPEEVRQYFPVETVVKGTLGIYQDLLALKFKEVPADAWVPEAQLFEVHDADDGRLIGHFFLDLYPRDGKNGHAAAAPLVFGRDLEGGAYRRPLAAMIANFSKPTRDKPSLLTHDEVETFFHEFGHIMHQVLGQSRYASFSGSSVALDFVEGPSQMMEGFVWQPEVLRRLSGHYKDPSRKLPPELLEKMLAGRRFLAALINLRQVALASLDFTYNTRKPPLDTTALVPKVFAEVGFMPPAPGTQYQARFGHLASDYAAGYYSYLWSKVFAEDMFSVFERNGVVNPSVGRAYRHIILEKGSSEDEAMLLREFLGREPDMKAFMVSIGAGKP